MESKDKTTSSTNSLMPAVQTQVNSYLNGVGNVYNRGGALPRRNSHQNRAMKDTRNLALQPVPGLAEAQGYVTGLLGNGGMTQTMQQGVDYLKSFADGSYQEDPRLKELLSFNADQAANATATRFGRSYGSSAIGNAMGSAIANANNGIMLQSNENTRNRQMQAAQAIGALGQSGASNALTAGSMVGGLNDLRYDGASRLAGVGDWYSNWNKNNLQGYAAALSPFLGAGVTTTQTKPGPSTAQSILGGAATGGAMLGPWGAIGGGILGAFS